MIRDATKAVLSVLADAGLLLQQDKHARNVVHIITGETLKTSWWTHEKGRLIFTALSELADHKDVLFAKLVATKVTLVHRQLWPALLTVVSTAENWQLHSLSRSALQLLSTVNNSEKPVIASGSAIKELEHRLLVQTQQTHTESGSHAILARQWSLWAKDAKVKPLRSSIVAKRKIENAVKNIGAEVAALPWVRA